MNSTELIGRVVERYGELSPHYKEEWDVWRAFYNGWLEGRIDLFHMELYVVAAFTDSGGYTLLGVYSNRDSAITRCKKFIDKEIEDGNFVEYYNSIKNVDFFDYDDKQDCAILSPEITKIKLNDDLWSE